MRVLWLTLVVLFIDQATKFAVVQNMHLYQSIPLLGDWFRFTYTTNPGIAFGITFGPPGMLSVLALIVTCILVGYLWTIRDRYKPYRYALACILGGALGNIIDRTFYGLIYGYDGLFRGQVVDFVHVNLYNGVVNLPLVGPTFLSLFPIWNVADMAIVLGLAGLFLYQNAFYREVEEVKEPEAAPTTSAEPPTQP